jgi:hypothetical protein
MRANVTITLLAAMALIALATALLDIFAFWLIAKLKAGVSVELEIERAQLLTTTMTCLFLGGLVLTTIGFLAWLSRSIENVLPLGGGRPLTSPRWAIGWWFVPLANLVMPMRVVADLHARTRPEGSQGGAALVTSWWLAWVAGLVAAYIPVNIYAGHFGSFPWPRHPGETLDAWSAYVTASTVADALHAASALLAVLVVRRIQRGAEARGIELAGTT